MLVELSAGLETRVLNHYMHLDKLDSELSSQTDRMLIEFPT